MLPGDGSFVLQRQSDGVETSIQTVFSEGVDLEATMSIVRGGHRLVPEVYRQLIRGRRKDVVHHCQDLVGLQHNRQHAVLEAVVVEDVDKPRRNDTAESLVEERTGRMFTRRSASKVIPCQKNRRALEARLIQKERRIL